jgi:hypothetical protein
MSTHKFIICCLLTLITCLSSACTPSSFPLELTQITVTPDPIVGQIVILHIEVMSTRDEKDAIIRVTLPEEVKLVEGELIWEGQLLANQPQVHELSICVEQEGNWRVWISTASRLAENSSYGDSEIIHLKSSTAQPTPQPIIVSSECSGSITMNSSPFSTFAKHTRLT